MLTSVSYSVRKGMSHNIIRNKPVRDTRVLNKELEQIQILIAESENELISLFEAYLSSLGVKTEIANSGEKALGCFLDSKKKESPYDAIMLDTHLHNTSGLDVAKKIRSEKPDQKLVLVTTTPKEYLPRECLNTARIEDKYILTMPFRLSNLVTALIN